MESKDRIENVIGPTSSYVGELKSDGGVRIDGTFKGSLETAGNVVVGEAAKVEADIVGLSVSVAGAVRGNITARGRLEILSTGQVWGDVSVGERFVIDEGGVINGKVSMGQPSPAGGQARSA